MSYILDALRRADAERQRGAVPGLHAIAPVVAAGGGAASARRGPLAWVVAAMLLVAVALAAWAIGRRDVAGAPAGAAPSAAVPLAVTVLTTPTPTPAPVAAQARPELPVPPTPPAGLSMTARSAAPATDLPPDAARTPAASAAATPAVSTLPGASASASSSAPAPKLAELSDDFRRQLPPLTLGGGMYSEQAANRLVIVNGQLVHEGEVATGELRIVQIRPRAVVFVFRGQRFEMPL
jgi:general secretion pathway protein B